MFTQVIDFIKSQYSEREFLSLHEPVFRGNEKKYLEECIDSTYVSSVGPFVNKFESLLSEKTQSKKAVAVVNGTSALHVALKVVGVSSGDEVITQALTFVATANAISYNNANPIFIDVDLDTMGLSPTALKSFLEEYGEVREDGCYNKKTGRKISACLPMHTFGFPVRIADIVKICNQYLIPVVEDAAEALGSYYNDKPLGSFGEVSGFSFNGNKIVTAGAGGGITTNDEKLGDKAKHITTTAKTPHPYKFIHDEIGYNYRMPNINAALICAQLEQLDSFLKNKRELAMRYDEFFTSKGIKFRKELEGTKANYWLMCIELDSKKDFERFLTITNKSGVMTRPIWELMSDLPMFQTYQTDSLKNSRILKDRIINIPSGVR